MGHGGQDTQALSSPPSSQDAVDVLRRAVGSLAITACLGYDPAEVEQRLADGQLQRTRSAVSLVSLDAGSRPGSRPVTPGSRPGSRAGSRPVTPSAVDQGRMTPSGEREEAESGRRSRAEDVSGREGGRVGEREREGMRQQKWGN